MKSNNNNKKKTEKKNKINTFASFNIFITIFHEYSPRFGTYQAHIEGGKESGPK